MKNLYAVLVLVFCSFVSNAQNVNIPDANFKTKLLNYTPVIDTNNDGEIQVSEALLVTELVIANTQITNMKGIGYFANLKILIFRQNNNITSIDLSGLINLEILNLSGNVNLSSINIEDLTSLKALSSSLNDNLITLDTSSLSNLEYLTIQEPNLGSLNVTGLTNLKSFNSYENNFITTLDFSNCTNLENIDISEYTMLTTLNVQGLSNLKFLRCGYTNLTSLNASNLVHLETLLCFVNNLTSLNVSGSINLVSLNCYRNKLDTIDLQGLINLEILDCSSNTLEFNSGINFLDLTDLIHLKQLNCSNNRLTTLNVFSNELTSLVCYNNSLSSLNINNSTAISFLLCNNNQLNELIINNLINLTRLDFSHNQITNIDLSSLSLMTELDCSNNDLLSLDITNNDKIRVLNCSNNQLTSIDLSNLSKLERSDFSHNLFSTLDFNGIGELDSFYPSNYIIDNNPNLISVNIKNGRLDFVRANQDVQLNCPNLNYICLDDIDIEYQLNALSGVIPGTINLNSYCSLNPGGTYNIITGIFSLDYDNNGCDATDYKLPNSKIKIDDASNIFGATYTNTTGNYNFFTQAGNFTITPEFENPYFTVSPASATITFADSNNNTQTQNFCVTPNGIHNDVEVSVLPVQRPRPGFDATYQIVYKNKGNQVLSGNVNLAFNDAVLDFVAANPAVSAQSLNALSWSYSNLLPFESKTIDFTLNVNSPQEIPAVNNGDVLNFSASIDPISGDETVNDNTFALTQTVLGSYDPNDKTCLEGNTIVPERIGEYLHYLIRFQNSGTAAAENIVVKDIIDTTKFDITSLQLTSASHNYNTKITGNKVEFIFENIQLPAEIDNEAASHGFVAFKIKTKNNLTLGNSVSNKADIYFDYNFPITTNEATTTFATLGVNQIENKSVAVFPNPVNDILTITSKGNLTSIQLLDVQGRLLATYLESEEKASINLSDKASGVYFVKIFTENGVKLEKIVKK